MLILNEADDHGFLDLTTVYGDGTHQKANANRNKTVKQRVEIAARVYEDELLDEINQVRAQDGKKPLSAAGREETIFDEETGEEKRVAKTKEITVSTTDGDCGIFHKGEHERCTAYELQTFCDGNGYVLAHDIVPGNIHDSVSFFGAYDILKERYGSRFTNVCLDAGYKTPPVCRQIVEDDKTPILPYKRPMTKKGFFRKHEFTYVEENNHYVCPNGEVLEYRTTNRLGYNIYMSDPAVCENCPMIDKCTRSRKKQKTITRHVWAGYIDAAEEIRSTDLHKAIYPKRKETIERVFADCKEHHCLRYTRVKGIGKNRANSTMVFASHNLKKLAIWKWKEKQMAAGSASF